MWRYSIVKAQRELGYQPQVPLAEGLPRTLEWYHVQER
jgi:nucleoside-diphosphate-sugar epimerase